MSICSMSSELRPSMPARSSFTTEGWFVPTGQVSRTVLVYLPDEESRQGVVAGAPDFREHITSYIPLTHPPADMSQIVGFRFNDDGFIRAATIGPGS